MFADLMTFGPVETPLKVLQLCYNCLASWTDKSRLFSKRLLQSCGNLVHQLAVQLKIFHAVWVPTGVSCPCTTTAESIELSGKPQSQASP